MSKSKCEIPARDETKMLNPKLETLNSKQAQMSKTQNSKPYDLRDRTLRFAKRVRNYVKNLSKTLGNIEDARQLIKASGSVGANYIEAEEALSRKDFVLRIKISRKEAKESVYWVELTESKEEQYRKTELDQGSNRTDENIWFNC